MSNLSLGEMASAIATSSPRVSGRQTAAAQKSRLAAAMAAATPDSCGASSRCAWEKPRLLLLGAPALKARARERIRGKLTSGAVIERMTTGSGVDGADSARDLVD